MGFYIIWKNANFRSDLGYWIDNGQIEIIGNLYQNPELWEEKQA
jgi:hypothetical protein